MTKRDAGIVLLGGLVGAAVALLFAPATGKETREKVGEWLKEKGEASKELLARGKKEAAQKTEQIGAAVKAGKEAYTAFENGRREKVAA